jgi:hypothetical protein
MVGGALVRAFSVVEYYTSPNAWRRQTLRQRACSRGGLLSLILAAATLIVTFVMYASVVQRPLDRIIGLLPVGLGLTYWHYTQYRQ